MEMNSSAGKNPVIGSYKHGQTKNNVHLAQAQVDEKYCTLSVTNDVQVQVWT